MIQNLTIQDTRIKVSFFRFSMVSFLRKFPKSKLILAVSILLVSAEPSIAQDTNLGVSRPIWAGASVKLDGTPTEIQLMSPLQLIAFSLLERVQEEGDQCIQDLLTNLKIDARGAPPHQISHSRIFDALSLKCTLSDLKQQKQRNMFAYETVQITVTGSPDTQLPQTFQNRSQDNSGFEAISIPVSLIAKLQKIEIFVNENGTISASGGSTITSVKGNFNNLTFSFRLNGDEDEFASEHIRDSIDATFLPQGIVTDWGSSSMTMTTSGLIHGAISASWEFTESSFNPQLKMNLDKVSICSSSCTAQIEHRLRVVAKKTPTVLSPSEGNIYRSALHTEKYQGTMSTLISPDGSGNVRLTWNTDLVIDKQHNDTWDQSLTTKSNTAVSQVAWKGNVANSARLLPASPNRSIVTTNVQKSLDSYSATIDICDPSDDEVCTQQNFPSEIYTRTREERVEKMIGSNPATRTGLGTLETNCPPQQPCGLLNFRLEGIYDSLSPKLLVTAPSDWAGKRIDLWSLHTPPGSLLILEDYGYPNQSYSFSVGSGNALKTVTARSNAVTLVPKNVVFISGITEHELENVFQHTIGTINSLLGSLAERGAQVSKYNAQSAVSFRTALSSIPEGSVVILFVHGGPTGISPGGGANGGDDFISGRELRNALEKVRAQAVYPITCFAGRYGLPHTALASIGAALGRPSAHLGELIGLGTNPIHASADQIIEALLKGSTCGR